MPKFPGSCVPGQRVVPRTHGKTVKTETVYLKKGTISEIGSRLVSREGHLLEKAGPPGLYACRFAVVAQIENGFLVFLCQWTSC